MLNLSRIQLELERAKEKLRNVEETIQKVEGKTFSNGPVRYGGPKADYHSDKTRNPPAVDDAKNPRRRLIPSTVDTRVQRLPADDSPFGLKRGLREKREPVGFKRQGGDARPQGVFARLSGTPFHQTNEEEEDDLGKKPTLPSRVYTTATEVPSRQEVIAAQAQDEQSKERNKRMFGALVGTLQKFRKEETRVREREEKRMKVERKLEEDAKREKEKLMQEKRELFLEKKRREVEIKRIEWSLNRVKEYEAWEAHVLPLKNFIQTQAKPHIFYLPSVHNPKTEERLAHSQKLVEKMIEKRKNNLKEEIENSEKKAKKAAAEDVEGEEAENIPEENEESVNAEQQMQVDFETKNKENGFFEEVKKSQGESPKDVDDGKEETKQENWGKNQQPDTKETPEVVESEKEDCSCHQEESKEERPIIVNKDSSNELNSISEERLSDKTGEGHLGESGNENEEKIRETGNCDEIKNESKNKDLEHPIESLEANEKIEVSSKETEKIEKTAEKTAQEEAASTEIVKSENFDSSQTTDSKPLSESERKTEDSSKKKLESNDEKNKTGERSLFGEKFETKRSNRRSRSLRKSRSPRNNSSRSKRRSSNSRQRRISRRQSSSSSPPRKSRRSRSPVSRRGQWNFSSRKRSPLNKSRKRKSSSQSSSSGSLRKKRSRSLSSSSSKSN